MYATVQNPYKYCRIYYFVRIYFYAKPLTKKIGKLDIEQSKTTCKSFQRLIAIWTLADKQKMSQVAQ